MLKGGGCFVFHGIKSNLAECSLNHVVVNKVFDTFDQDGEKKITFGTQKKWLQNTIDSSCMCTSTDSQEDGWVAKVKM